MKNRNKFWFIVVFVLIIYSVYTNIVFAISVTPISPSGKKVTGNQWLFVVGINAYTGWPQLGTAVNDAKAVKETLLSRYHFDSEHLLELYDEEATRANIIGKFRFLAQNLKEDDSLFIFYAGHGHLDSITKSGSWIPVESGTKDVSAWISNDYIKNYLKSDAIKAKHILLVSDSCFSGDFFRGHRGKLPEVTDETIRRSYELTSRQAITSGGLEPVVDSGFGDNSVFTHFFVKALKNNQSPFLVPSEFFTNIKAGVAENAEQFPQFGSLKNTGGQQGGEFVFFLKQDARLKNLSAIEVQKQREYERLKKMQQQADIAKSIEAEEIARKEEELAELDKKIEKMNKRLGTSEARIDDSLDAMLAMVRQKEEQAKKLELLRQQKEAEQKKREEKIAWLQKERGKKIIASLEAEIVKYREIVASKYGKSLKSSAWQALIAKCPSGWADGVDEGDVETILFSPAQRKEREKEEKKRFEETMGMKFVYVPKGCFMMGSNSGNSNEKPIHEVCLEGFWMGKYEVTQGQWNKIMGTNPSKFNSRDDFPVDNVSWNDAQNFILKLNQQFGNRFRLPTEAQWEYAAKSGGKKQKYAGGNDVGNLAWYDSNGYYKTRRVGTKAANGLGIYDMSGNVWEWCEDEFESNAYSKHDHYNPVVKSSSLFKVMRGGSWGSDATGVRVSNRSKRSCDVRGSANGFRLCIVKGWQ